jgi:hypothetical protein
LTGKALRSSGLFATCLSFVAMLSALIMLGTCARGLTRIHKHSMENTSLLKRWWRQIFDRKDKAKNQFISMADLAPGDLVVVELNRELIRGISLTTEEGIAAKLPESLTHLRGFVKRVNQVKAHGNSIGTISVLELLTAIRFNQNADFATRLEICVLEHETKSISKLG